VASLSTIERHGPLAPSELARIEGVRRPTVTRAVDRLVADGLVERARDERDGRATLLRATPHGKRLLAAVRRRKTAYLASRVERLDPEERALLAEAAGLLERMLAMEDA
jgi:DNA-binding MarR family transcriptional regulator